MRLIVIAVLQLSVLRLALAGPAPIVGGTTVPQGKWPDVVAVIGVEGTCTGTLIAPDVVLTAGHCIALVPVEVVTHTVDIGTPYPGDHIKVKWSREYPNWSERYDVGVIVLERMARPPARAVASACLANELLASGAPLTVVGFGLVTPDASDANTRLHEAVIPVIDPFCEQAPGCNATVRPNGEIAAGGRGSDTCFGDSGGPAYLVTARGPVLAGVVSRGLAVPGAPCGSGGIYVRADKVVAWIQSVTDRRLERARCERPGDEPADTDEENGCSTTQRHGGISVAMVALALIARRRRRWIRSSRS